jgi:hypothetical protein
MSRLHGEPDEPTEGMEGSWRRHANSEAVMRQAYDNQRHGAAAAVLEFLGADTHRI